MSCYGAAIELPCTTLGDYWPPSVDMTGKIMFGPIQFQDADTLATSNPTTVLDRVVVTMSLPSSTAKKYIIDSDSPQTRDAEVVITNSVGIWTFEIRTIMSFLPKVGDWSADIAIYHGGATRPLTIYTSTITVFPQV